MRDAHQPIQDDADYQAVLAEIYAFDDATYERGTPASERLDALVSVVQVYEAALIARPAPSALQSP